jgi:tRNA (mo5U34)-methyltransferase
MSAPARLSREEIEREVNSVPFWWHSIEIGGVTTPGKSEPERQRRIVRTFPGLGGKSVLDVAAWDGFFSFEAERLGADRLFSYGEPRFHHCSVSASSVQMSSHSEV